jgi:hypothetical protein
VAWKDNKAVYAASNKYTAECATTVHQFCRQERKNIQVEFKINFFKTLTTYFALPRFLSQPSRSTSGDGWR